MEDSLFFSPGIPGGVFLCLPFLPFFQCLSQHRLFGIPLRGIPYSLAFAMVTPPSHGAHLLWGCYALADGAMKGSFSVYRDIGSLPHGILQQLPISMSSAPMPIPRQSWSGCGLHWSLGCAHCTPSNFLRPSERSPLYNICSCSSLSTFFRRLRKRHPVGYFLCKLSCASAYRQPLSIVIPSVKYCV